MSGLKTVEFYMQTLKEYTEKLKKEKGTDKITLLMQVGEFFEIYGLIYPNGNRVGNVWEFCDDTNLKVALKPQVVYNQPEIKVYMGGVGEAYVNPYIQKAVEQFGWTIVIFDQHRIGNSDIFERKEQTIISPGININSDNFSNITLFIYMEHVKSYYVSNHTHTHKHLQGVINIGLSFIDCLSGENGVMAINNAPAGDISIPMDEILKLLTIKNPRELVIFLENIEPGQISDDDLITGLHLFNYNYKIIREAIPEQTHKPQYQIATLDKVYIKHRGKMDILQQLSLDGPEHNYSRIALILLIEFIMKHDRTIILKLEMPEVILNSDNYLMLANNCLEQLDIIDNMGSSGCSGGGINGGSSNKHFRRVSLLQLLDNTKTPIGKLLFRQRLSIPITKPDILETRYNQLAELYSLHEQYSNVNINSRGGDKYGSPLYQLRHKLGNIKNIENFLRKIITHKIQPFEISTYLESLIACSDVVKYIKTIFPDINTMNTPNTSNTSNTSIREILKLIPSDDKYKSFLAVQVRFKSDLILDNLGYNVWNGVISNPFTLGVCPELDELQNEINSDREFLDNLINELSYIIDSKYNPIKDKPLISTGENATKGIHIFTNTTRKDILEKYFSKSGNKITVGTHILTAKDIKFLKMKESKWELEIPLLKISNGSLKVNIDRMGKFARAEFIKWLQANIINDNDKLDALSAVAHFIGEIDVIQSNVINAIERGYTRPIISSADGNSYIRADNMRHPIIEYISQNTKYIPNDIKLGAGYEDGMLLFGVNAVGKSSLMKSVGVNIIMAQAGMYVASSHFEYKPFKYLFTRILGNDNLYAGLSSFEVEMKEFKVILKYADADSILLCDELFRGTQVSDAEALVASGLEILSRRGVKFVSATHLHNLTQMPCVQNLGNIKSWHLLVEQDKTNPRKLIYSRKLQPGSGPSSYGILVADAMNIDDEFVARAKEIRVSMDSRDIVGSRGIQVGSKYNKDKIIGKCEVCQNKDGVDVHHINQQCDANSVNLIDHSELGLFNKNQLWNLVSLCKDCHIAVHNNPAKLIIDGYKTTSTGPELSFKWVDLTAVGEGNGVGKDMDKGVGMANGRNDGNKKVNHSGNGDIPPDVLDIIRTMKYNNATPKKIQFDVKRKYGIEITQQFIRNLQFILE